MSRPRVSERRLTGILAAVIVLLGVGKFIGPDVVPVSALTIPMMIAGWRLSTRSVLLLTALAAAVLAADLANTPVTRSFLAAAVIGVICVLAYRYAALREGWGMSMTVGVPLLLDIRDRVRAQGEPPELPADWVMTRALRSAGEEAMRGDFTLAHLSGECLQVMVVDVSGHGVDVGPRAVQVAGAFGGLMGVLEPEDLMRACNDYLLRQEWERHYATAVHAALQLTTGEVTVRVAGHPPPQVRSVSGSWQPLPSKGPLFGLVPQADFVPASVRLEPGDVLVMVSDGALDERSDAPWAAAVRAVERWVADGIPSGSHEMPAVAHASSDDQTIVVVHRVAEASSD
ncbi:MAG: PP2C family protein-serine/threonine phosphatase [Jiangellales bacterium]